MAAPEDKGWFHKFLAWNGHQKVIALIIMI